MISNIIAKHDINVNTIYKNNGFKYNISDEDIKAIVNSKYVVLDKETTGLTSQSKPVVIGNTAKIGPELNLRSYLAEYGGGINCSMRARVLAIQLDSGKHAWDLDYLSVEDKKKLFDTVIDNKIVIGHNLSFDFSWARHITDKKPKYVLDTLMLARCLKPGLSWQVYTKAADGDEDANALLQKMVDNSASLETLSVATQLGKPSKEWQHPRNWCVEHLSRGHYDYVMSDVDAPLQLLYKMTKQSNFDDAMMQLEIMDNAFGNVYRDIYSKVPFVLAGMHKYGMPLNADILNKIHQHRIDLIPALADKVIDLIPGMITYAKSLHGMVSSMSGDIKRCLTYYLSVNGFEVKISEDGTPILNSKSLKLSGATVLEGMKAWEALQKAKKAVGFCAEFKSVSVEDEIPGWLRMRPLISAAAVTLRTTSQAPNSQNLPRPDSGLDDMLQIRSAVHARPGRTLVSADYGQIELRIAGALAVRAYDETIRAIRTRTGCPAWFLKVLDLAESRQEIIAPNLADRENWSFDDNKKYWALAWRNVKKSGPVMANIFRRDLDPHLATGIGMAIRQGMLPGVTDAIQYLSAADKILISELKKKFKDQRQGAKPLNFGLLYGMGADKLWVMGITDYGLSWSLEEAKAAYDAWFAMFADIKWWQIWEPISKRALKDEAVSMKRRDKYSKEVEVQDVRLMLTSTLAGRPIVCESKLDALNYSDQGTGADMALKALVEMPERFQACVINLIHDELMLEVLIEDAEEAQQVLQASMLKSANEMLSKYDIPAEADPAQSLYWRKE